MLKKMFFLCMSGLIFSSVALSADCQSNNHNSSSEQNHEIKRITREDVTGIYQISGFTNSLDGLGTIAQPQSQVVVGQVQFLKNGQGRIKFIDYTAVVGGQIATTHFESVPFSYTLGPINGSATVTVPNFPADGITPTFAISFKMRDGNVLGFSQLAISSTAPSANWILLQGKRFN